MHLLTCARTHHPPTPTQTTTPPTSLHSYDFYSPPANHVWPCVPAPVDYGPCACIYLGCRHNTGSTLTRGNKTQSKRIFSTLCGACTHTHIHTHTRTHDGGYVCVCVSASVCVRWKGASILMCGSCWCGFLGSCVQPCCILVRIVPSSYELGTKLVRNSCQPHSHYLYLRHYDDEIRTKLVPLLQDGGKETTPTPPMQAPKSPHPNTILYTPTPTHTLPYTHTHTHTQKHTHAHTHTHTHTHTQTDTYGYTCCSIAIWLTIR